MSFIITFQCDMTNYRYFWHRPRYSINEEIVATWFQGIFLSQEGSGSGSRESLTSLNSTISLQEQHRVGNICREFIFCITGIFTLSLPANSFKNPFVASKPFVYHDNHVLCSSMVLYVSIGVYNQHKHKRNTGSPLNLIIIFSCSQ